MSTVYKQYRNREFALIAEVRAVMGQPSLWVDQTNRGLAPYVATLGTEDVEIEEASWWTGSGTNRVRIDAQRAHVCMDITSLWGAGFRHASLVFDRITGQCEVDGTWETVDLGDFVMLPNDNPKTQTPTPELFKRFRHRQTGFRISLEDGRQGNFLRIVQGGEELAGYVLQECEGSAHEHTWRLAHGFKLATLRADGKSVVFAVQARHGLGRCIASLKFDRISGLCKVVGDWDVRATP